MAFLQMVDLIGQYKRLQAELDPALQEVYDSCYFVGGPVVKRFSENLQEYLKVKHVIPCANGTDALQIALMALDLQEGDEVITTPFTFIATAEVIALLKLKPVFVDVNPCTFTIDEYRLREAITDRTRCIIPVHLFGQGANMKPIMDIAEEYNLFVVEDNAQAIGATYRFPNGKKQMFGTIGHIGCTSFFPSKNLGCFGDGGAIFTNDDNHAFKIRKIANHGSSKRYYHDEVGVNSRLDALQAAVLNVKLKHLDNFGAARQKAAAYYTENLKNLEGVTCPKIANYSDHVFHQYTLLVENGRNKIIEYLTQQEIASGVYYPVPLHLQEAYQWYGYEKGDFPVSEDLSKKVISLPIHTELNPKIQDRIINAFKEGLKAVSNT